jgi:hypothetical protein
VNFYERKEVRKAKLQDIYDRKSFEQWKSHHNPFPMYPNNMMELFNLIMTQFGGGMPMMGGAPGMPPMG